ncbi:phenylalanine--tRNA ligase subunit beta [Candidatus Nomurabacteria bacterium]|nr:phenylalanine--tRNA ligase subunit beta [Candidatus Nomurabacteria bacterium]
MKISRNWLQTYFEKELPSIQDIDQLLVTHSFETEGIERIGDDDIIDIDVLPNRAHDCLSYEGIANELAGLMNTYAKDALGRYEKREWKEESGKGIDVQIANPTQCRRYATRIIENIEVKESPKWLKDRLAVMGQRPINNIVDATNYVLFDFGQPTHVFDYSKISEKIIARNAYKGETLTVLGGQELELDESMLLIADIEKPLALAGVKGGIAAEVDTDTKNIVLEVANFEPISTRTTRNKVGIFTDASKRYENELSPEVVPDALEALTRLIINVAGTPDTTIGALTDQYPLKQQDMTVAFTTEHTNRLTGFSLSDEDIIQILERFNYSFSKKDTTFTVEIPPRRYDLRIAEDMIEEIARIYGYNNLTPISVSDITWGSQINKMVFYQNKIRNVLIQHGYSEIMTYSFVKKGEVEMLNALASDKKALRSNISEGFREALEFNLRNTELFGSDRVTAFEFDKVFEGGEERWQLALGVQNKDKKARKKYGNPHEQLVAIVEVLNSRLQTALFVLPTGENDVVEWNLEKIINELPEIDQYDDIFSLGSEVLETQFTPFSLFPFMTRDVALWAPSTVDPQEIIVTLSQHAGDLCRRIDLFDTYQPDGEERISYAFKLIFQAMDRTLTDDEVNPVMDQLYARCNEKGWETR